MASIDFLRLSNASIAGMVGPNNNHNLTSQPWLSYGEDNLYPNHLIRYRTYSPTHSAILKLKHDLLIGEGFLNLPTDQSLISQVLLERLGLDYVLFGGFALEVIWSRDGAKVAAVKHIPFSHLRLGQPQDTAEINEVYLSRNWEAYVQHRNLAYQPLAIPLFSASEGKTHGRQVWYYADYSPDWAYYPMAAYQAALPDILWDFEYSQFKTANMQNGMFPALHISVEGEPTEEERQHFYRELKRKFSGSAQAGEVLITYGQEGAGKVSIAPIEVRGNADLFRIWAEDTMQRIITAHRLTSPVLAGLPGRSGVMGRGNEISVASEHFFNTVIRPMQLTILGQIQQIAAFAGLTVNNLEISNSKPIRLVFEEDLLAKLLTIDELRQELGYEPLPNSINDQTGRYQTVAQSVVSAVVSNVPDPSSNQDHATPLHPYTNGPRLKSDPQAAQ